MKLLTQPGDGIDALLRGIEKAKKTIEIVIFRFDRRELERALESAVKRGVSVHALIAYTNRGGEKNLRKLELRFLAAGVTVARTADDLVRYHGKMMLVDRKELYMLAFNFTYLDIENSRSFGIITKNSALVKEAAKVFHADTKRRAYRAGSPNFLVSPVNARKQLSAFIKEAREELLIYDLQIADRSIINLLRDRTKAGVRIQVIGGMKRKVNGIAVRQLNRLRLHARVVIRDRSKMFIGSQSLRELELDARRELGIIFRDSKVIPSVIKTFEADWEAGKGDEVDATEQRDAERAARAAKKVAKKVTKTVTKRLPPVAPVVEKVVKQLMEEHGELELKPKEVESNVREAVEDAVKETVRGLVEDAATAPDANGK